MNDSAMRKLLHRLARSDANAADSAPGINASATRLFPLSDRREATASSSRLLNAHLKDGHQDNDSHLFVQRHLYTNDVASYVDQERRLRHVNSGDSSRLNVFSDFKHQYTSLLHRFSVNWAKLYFMEPRVFGKSDNIRG